ncbi:MAG: hypothetical protein J0H01_21395 [Rhizobiales bacterium]|nr:hypothetical protein [Hyphomicrobiales bacterium]
MPSEKPKRILVAYSMMSTFTPTTLEYLLAIKKFTDYQVHYIHVTHDARMGVDFNDYDVVIHNYCARLCFEGYISAHYERAMAHFRGLKIVCVQDDYDRTAVLHRAIRRLGFHVLLTCIQREFWPLVYPQSELPGLSIVQGLTGYMPERLIEARPTIAPLSERKTWVAYRGRDIGAKYGRLGFEKYEIGRRMVEICEGRGVPHDIAMDNDSRIYGDAWFDFLGSSRTMLGAESGSNAFDFDGDLEARIDEFKIREGRAPTYHEFKPILDPIEAPFNIGQISPRVFETAVMRTPMINFRGSYSDVIKPDVHYIALEKDFSNIDVVLSKLDNIDILEGFTTRAYETLVQSGTYGYRSLARLVTETIETQYPLRVNQAWIQYRRATGTPWHAPAQMTPPETEEDARQIALLERPTDFPLNSDTLNDRQDLLSSLLKDISERRSLARTADIASEPITTDNAPEPIVTDIVPEPIESLPSTYFATRFDRLDHATALLNGTFFWRPLRLVWRATPSSLRRFILRKFGRTDFAPSSRRNRPRGRFTHD